MERRFLLKCLTASILTSPLLKLSHVHAQTGNSPDAEAPLRLQLSGPGRIGFYIDYSELDTVGTHTFYVCRTHGTTGPVSVNYSTHGDTHSTTSGTLSWADGEADIKSFQVTVSSKTPGDHRIWAELSNPQGGAVLHNSEYTIAYGVIDDGSIAPNSDAVFYDAAAPSGGDGSQQSPFNSLNEAIDRVGEKRYIYGKGTTRVDTTNPTNIGGNSGVYTLPVPATRNGESNRVYIRNWPGNEWTITGVGTNRGGFYTNNGESYHTFRGIKFSNLDTTGPGVNGFGIFYQYSNPISINIELCEANNINGSTNNGAYMLWGCNSYKVWRCTGNNIQKDGNNQNSNTSMFLTYDGKNGSVQRCEASNCNSIVYHKRIGEMFDVSTSVRFCIDSTQEGVLYGASGSGGFAHSYTVVQSNLFKPGFGSGITHKPGSDGLNPRNSGQKHWWCNNVFHGRGYGEIAAIHFRQGYHAAIFNNIMFNSRKVWADTSDTESFGGPIEFADYNQEYGTTLESQKYEYKGVNYSSRSALESSTGFASNDSNQDPLFTDNNLYRLNANSPARNSGVFGVDKGIYLIGIEIIGASNLNTPQVSPPETIGLEVDIVS